MMRRLGDRYSRIRHRGHQPPNRERVREKVGVEHQNEFAVGLSERVIDVAGFRALVVGTREPYCAEIVAERAEPRTAAIVEHVDGHLAAPLDASAGENGALEDFGAFVERRDEDVYACFTERRRMFVAAPDRDTG